MKNDILIQAYSAMRHDVRKTLLTMLGMAWGIATVVLLLAYGRFRTCHSQHLGLIRRDRGRHLSRQNFAAGGRKQSWGASALHQRRYRTPAQCRSSGETFFPHW